MEKLGNAHFICYPEYGYFISLNEENPLCELSLEFPDSCEFLHSSHAFGENLFLKSEGDICAIAYIFHFHDEGGIF